MKNPLKKQWCKFKINKITYSKSSSRTTIAKVSPHCILKIVLSNAVYVRVVLVTISIRSHGISSLSANNCVVLLFYWLSWNLQHTQKKDENWLISIHLFNMSVSFLERKPQAYKSMWNIHVVVRYSHITNILWNGEISTKTGPGKEFSCKIFFQKTWL